MDGKRILVTGGAGFIGSNLANHLAEDNEVIVVDDLSIGSRENVGDDVEFHETSVLADDLPTENVDVVFHLAAVSTLHLHEEDTAARRNGARVNVEGFVNTVDQARQDGCDTVVYATTSSIYGSRTEPSAETLPVEANTGYEASKLARERYAEYFQRYHDMTMAGLRYFSVYQGYGGAEAHKDDFANVISQFADDVADGESPVLYGDGSQTRDFTHVDDVVRATVLAAEHELGGIYNVGTGEQYSFNDVVERLADILGNDVEPEYVENPIDEDVYVHDTLADASKIHDATGWEPEVDFEEGLRRVCEPYL
ncbi:MAG: UDP-glucose 4-epimerase [Halobacteriales archaeon]|jgi:UDP-glucose 4-epimerase